MRINLKQTADFLRENDDYLILMHASPDGDTLGCGAALCEALHKLGKRAKTVCPEEIPSRFGYLFKNIEKQNFEEKTIVCVDVADTRLLGNMEEIGDKAELCIDHHHSNTNYARRLYVDEKCAAACEIIYELILELGVEINVTIANAVYTGTATDTGCFRYSNTTAQSHRIAAKMIEFGAEFAKINYLMFVMKTRGRLKLEQESLKNIKFYENGKIAAIFAPLSLIKSIEKIDSDDIGALANIPREIEGVEVGICIKEKKGGVLKASLRSSDKVDCSKIAEKFGGGGHIRASGCSRTGGTLEEFADMIAEECVKALKAAGENDK